MVLNWNCKGAGDVETREIIGVRVVGVKGGRRLVAKVVAVFGEVRTGEGRDGCPEKKMVERTREIERDSRGVWRLL